MKKNKYILVIGTVIVLCIITLIISRHFQGNAKSLAKQQLPADPDMLEIPLFTANRTGQTIEHCAYTVSYNEQWRIPNWVAYELTREEASGTLPRGQFFVPDPDVKGATAQYYDYKDSGFDHGHMAPAGDMKWDHQAMEECFYLSNICPQDHDLNSGDWRILEERIRGWARQYQSIYIVCGPVMSDHPQTIGPHHVAVPDGFFKVILCKIRGEWNAVGFYFENKPGHKPLREYCKSIDEMEKLTGMDFFAPLDDSIENRIEAAYDTQAWGLAR